MTLVSRLSSVLERRISRRSFVTRSAFAGSALTAGGVDFLLKPQTAYESLCYCGNPECSCGTTCCAGYTEFCCVLDGGYNSCPADTVMGGWWQAEGSDYCAGTRYYMDCNAVCKCDSGCGSGYQFCDTGCDGLHCGCADGSCDHYLTGCFQFRYGQCNQDVKCIGRIKCRVVTCVPPWEIDNCTHAIATDDYTANQTAGCVTSGPTYPPPVCPAPETKCEVVSLAMSRDFKGYGMVTKFGHAFFFGNDRSKGEVDRTMPKPISGIETSALGGYWFVNEDGRVFAFGNAKHYGDAYNKHLVYPVVAMVGTRSGRGYYLVTSHGRVMAFGDAKYYGEPKRDTYPQPFVDMAITKSGKGYWLLTAGGRILTYGDATDHGHPAYNKYSKPFVAICRTPSGRGYWCVTAAGQVVSFGSAGMHGAGSAQKLTWPVVDMQSSATGRGYYLVTTSGEVMTYGDAKSYGSARG